MSRAKFCRTTTVLPVRDIAESTGWYERVLGMKTTYLHEGDHEGEATNYAVLQRDNVCVHLVLDERPLHGDAWTQTGVGYLHLSVSDVDALLAEVEASGVEIARGLATENWGARGFNLTDPNGNTLHIEQDE